MEYKPDNTVMNIYVQDCRSSWKGSEPPWYTLTKNIQSHYTKKPSEIIAEILDSMSYHLDLPHPCGMQSKSIDEVDQKLDEYIGIDNEFLLALSES